MRQGTLKRGTKFDERIKSLVDSGLSNSEIAILLSLEYADPGIVKDVVSGRIHRLGYRRGSFTT